MDNFKQTDYSVLIYKLRTERNLTQKQMADLIGVSDRTISKWEKGLTNPDIECIQRICFELNISADLIINSKYTFKDKFNRLLRNITKWIRSYYKKIIISCFCFLFFIKFIFLLDYFIKNNNSINIYNLIYESDDITIDNSMFIDTLEYNILTINDLSINLEYVPSNIYIEVFIYVDEDKYMLYEGDLLESIYIDGNFDKSIIDGIKSGIYINIITTYKNTEYIYKCNLILNSIYSNPKYSE